MQPAATTDNELIFEKYQQPSSPKPKLRISIDEKIYVLIPTANTKGITAKSEHVRGENHSGPAWFVDINNEPFEKLCDGQWLEFKDWEKFAKALGLKFSTV